MSRPTDRWRVQMWQSGNQKRFSLLGFALTALLLAGFGRRAAAQEGKVGRVTLAEAVQKAVAQNPAVAAGRSERQRAEAAGKQARGGYGPTLGVEANALFWDRSLDVTLGPEPFTVRETFTSEVTVSATQPLVGLYGVRHRHRRATLEVDVVEAELRQTRRRVVLETVIAFYRVLQAKNRLETARQSVEQIGAQVDRMRRFVEAGRVQKNELLRLKVARAAAQQDALEAENRLEVGRARLATEMGRSIGAPVEPVEPDGSLDDGAGLSLEEAYRRATDERPEIDRLDRRQAQTRAGIGVARAQLLPQLALQGAYRHTEGFSFLNSNVFFGGVVLNWNVFEWGRRYYAIDEARARMRGVGHRLEEVRREIRLQVKVAHADLRTARERLQVARAAVDQATEAFRVETERVKQGVATTTNLLDAETALTEARNNKTDATYGVFIARARLRHAIGLPITKRPDDGE